MKLIGLRNTSTQTVDVDGLVNIGTVYRKNSIKDDCCVSTFSNDTTTLSLNHKGIYHITVTAIVSAPVAGNVTLQLFANGVEIQGALATETITTATTEFHTLTIDTYVLVNNANILGIWSASPVNLTLVNTGVESTISNVVVNATKEV